jgi:hypothetical protein
MNAARAALSCGLLLSLAAAGLGWNKAIQLRAENAGLRAELAKLNDQAAVDQETERQKTRAEIDRLQSEAREVHKLRGEVTQLRSRSGETEKLRAENTRLRDAARAQSAGAQNPAAPPSPAPEAKNYFPRDAWSFSGYTSPESALVSAIWSMREGNPKSYLDSLAPEEQARVAATWQNKSETEIAAKHQQDVSTITGMRVLDRQEISPNETVLSVFVEGVNRAEKVSMKRVGEDWKFGGFIRDPKK